MTSYQAPYVASDYDINRHMGHYYELGFRDLYAASPHCDCMHTYKILDDEKEENYHEAFEFKCKFLGRTTSIIDERPVALSEHPAVYNQSMSWTHPQAPIPGLDDAVFNTAKFKTVPGQEQYEWVIEFTCGTQPEDFMKHMFPGGFVGLNLYSRTGPLNSTNLQEMEDTVRSLGLDWVMDDWGWGYHHVPHEMDCKYNSPDETEYACNTDTKQCEPVHWGTGVHIDECSCE
eukprot:CAMPEP_0114445078 /NCGR_PEP_ID=MMETSP0103-20121206/18428_1 /TAXON_ID=37642 ORGANISM="Paraphysomonas imperforata, Strain PA2" /NCGR_SAMPLE_ID=MMETSP0103 /ASSEMBLY_ACC=CAM_ASM_000201 /LENGTH=230 /DNA_ID=CAMNT_0001616659 /DNA_START=148 /DNA_END=841 /DNA_ORIENTATION=+